MNILSLFDGMSCGQQALERSGIKVDNYYASEIDKYAIKVTMANYPNTIQLGSVVGVDRNDYGLNLGGIASGYAGNMFGEVIRDSNMGETIADKLCKFIH